MKYVLVSSRYMAQIEDEYDSLSEAVESALHDLEYGEAWPLLLRHGDEILWRQNGPFCRPQEQLQALLGDDKTENLCPKTEFMPKNSGRENG